MMKYDTRIQRDTAAGRAKRQYRETVGPGRQYASQRHYVKTGNAVFQSRETMRASRQGIDRESAGARTRSRKAVPQKNFRSKYRKRKRAGFLKKSAVCLALVFGLLALVRDGISLAVSLEGLPWANAEATPFPFTGEGTEGDFRADKYTEKLEELLEKNEETADYVKCYPERETYKEQSIDLTGEMRDGDVPLLMQWDKRWGYNAYGNNMIGLAGCGPVCLTMAYLYYTGDTGMTPREMAAFASDNGYYTEEVGTKWSLWTEGVRQLGLNGEELPLDEGVMKQALDMGQLIVCSMGPGDFTTDGHFILIRGYDENGFYVNDPNRKSNSSRQWDFDTLQYQIRNLWALYG